MKKILFLFTIAGMLGVSPRASAQTSLVSPPADKLKLETPSAESHGSPASTATAAAKPSTVDFENVTVTDAANMSSKPKVTAKSSLPAARLKVKDLVVGTGQAASPTSTVVVQYLGVRYADGKQFDSSWDRGGPTDFPLNRVVKGFTQGIGGNDTVAPMKVGGRRLMILPAELGYGERGTPDGSIPPNATLVFVVDLISVN